MLRKTLLLVALPVAITIGLVVAFEIPAVSVSSASSSVAAVGETIFIHVVNSTSGEPVSNESLTAGSASSLNDISITPGGPALKECVHEVPSGAMIGQNDEVIYNGTTTTFVPCPVVSYTTNATGWVTISNQNTSYFFIKVGNVMINNWDIITPDGSRTYVTVPFPQGSFVVSSTNEATKS